MRQPALVCSHGNCVLNISVKVTLITVCYNSAAHIASALRSVDAQSWPDIEHLIIDGASLDDTLQVVPEHCQPWRQVLSESDLGIYDAMNKGLALATGDIVGFLNADDTLADTEVVARVARAAEAGAVAVYGDLEYVSATGQRVRYWKAGAYHRQRLARGWMPPHPTFYARRELFQCLGGFDLRYRIAADYDLMLRFLARGGVTPSYVPEVQVRMLTGGVSNRSLSNLMLKSFEDWQVLRRNRVGGLLTLLAKNLVKIPQFLHSLHAGAR